MAANGKTLSDCENTEISNGLPVVPGNRSSTTLSLDLSASSVSSLQKTNTRPIAVEDSTQKKSQQNFNNPRFEFPEYPRTIENFLKHHFEIRERNVSIQSEISAGCLHFISIIPVLSLVPDNFALAGYNLSNVTIICSFTW